MTATAPRTVRFAARLRALLDERRMGQGELAERAGLSPSQVSRLLACKREPTPETVGAIAAALRLSTESLVRGTDAADASLSVPSRRELDVLRDRLAELELALERERDARVEADERLAEARARLAHLGAVRNRVASLRDALERFDGLIAEEIPT